MGVTETYFLSDLTKIPGQTWEEKLMTPNHKDDRRRPRTLYV